ncbi:MAG: isoleucine--tRNA ligase [bacterium]|nr:isoleucine--tRNA ligase [bacterium]MDZ4247794.1 isoleucine--tRNA ligase [Patescibacteria group bacterium]
MPPKNTKQTIKKPQPVESFPELEESLLRLWKREGTFKKSLDKTKKGKRFVFYDGPPYATGKPHTGHLLPGTLKDVVPRFKTMQGRYVERRFGWDCHGLPVEYELEKELGIKQRQEIEEMGIGTFNDKCRSIVLRFTKEWEKVTNRLGRWADFENDYKTMDPEYMESIWHIVKTLHEKDLLYEGHQSMHVCPRCATPLSNFEVALGYADRNDPAVFVKFPLATDPYRALVAWTTTPWTLPGNVLLAVNPDFQYVEVEHEGEKLIVAKSRLKETFGEKAKVRRTFTARELAGTKYTAPFPVAGLKGKHYQVVTDDSVTADEGTGILHVAPAFGEDDMRIGRREGAPLVQHVKINGEITEPFDRHHGMQALEANEPILADLKRAGRLLRKESVTHSYPHCWRCDTPLLNYATRSWFVSVEKLKKRLVKENQEINWTPEHIRDGRFGQWLEGARDWAISRYRFWGTPIPIWRCENGHLEVIGSRAELKQRSGKAPADLHRQHIDQITFKCKECKQEMRRIEDILDVWFDSGSMPFAQQHYPFEHKDDFKDYYPADFISEAADQTRGWFYTLHVLGTAMMNQKAYKNVVLLGLILAEDGRKLSKRLKNFPELDPFFAEYGADAIRLYLMMQPIVRGEAARFSEKAVGEVLRNFTGTLFNAYTFHATYAAVDKWKVGPPPAKPRHLLDRWVLARLDELVRDVTGSLEKYDMLAASRGLYGFVDELSNWYIRRSRRRFWKSGDDVDKREAFATLHHVLTTFCRLAAPFAPFITDHIHRELSGESVHLAEWPAAKRPHDAALLKQMQQARQAVRLGLAARSQAKVRVRQPLAAAYGPQLASPEIGEMVKAELNVKDYRTFDDADGSFGRNARPVPKEVAKVAGDRTQSVLRDIKAGKYKRGKDGTYTVGTMKLPAEAVELQYEKRGHVTESDGTLTVSLDTSLDPALVGEGLAREVIRHVQAFRKKSGLNVEDRIDLALATDASALSKAIETHRDLIAGETLASSLALGDLSGEAARVDIGEHQLRMALKRT